jgi:hypothetical protein
LFIFSCGRRTRTPTTWARTRCPAIRRSRRKCASKLTANSGTVKRKVFSEKAKLNHRAGLDTFYIQDFHFHRKLAISWNIPMNMKIITNF